MEFTPSEAPAVDLESMIEVDAIKRLKYRYIRFLDQKRWNEMRGILTDDAVAAYGGGRFHFDGADAILDFLVRSMGADTFHSSHRVHHPEIDLTGPDTASGLWAMDDVVILTDWDVTIRGSAYYSDEYRKVDGVWKISRTGYKRIYEEMESRSDQRNLRVTASWWTTGGVSEIDPG